MGKQTHRSDPRVLSRRTLEHDHRRLGPMLERGMRVLDVGCGTGSITAGIAGKVGPNGQVVGLDRDESLLAEARQAHGELANLSFQSGDVEALTFKDCFDIVTAARTLQWLSNPAKALREMVKAAKPSGRVIVLDYNHEDNRLDPPPPPEFDTFYQAFLRWRADNGWSNRMAGELPALFEAAGLAEIQVHVENEFAYRGDAATAIWAHVMDSLGPKIVSAGYLSEAALEKAIDAYRAYLKDSLSQQTLVLRAIEGRKPFKDLPQTAS